VTTTDDGVIKVAVRGLGDELGLLVLGYSTQNDVVSGMKRNEPSIIRCGRVLVNTKSAEVGH
jgi:hypothetical protein